MAMHSRAAMAVAATVLVLVLVVATAARVVMAAVVVAATGVAAAVVVAGAVAVAATVAVSFSTFIWQHELPIRCTSHFRRCACSHRHAGSTNEFGNVAINRLGRRRRRVPRGGPLCS